MTSIKEVARAAGVSVTTVSYVLNDKGNISPETRQRVLDVIQQLGYTPSTQARNLREQQARIIGYPWRAPLDLHEGNPVLDTFLHAVIQGLEATGRHLLIFDDPIDKSVPTFSEMIDSQRVDGFIIANTEDHDPRIAFLHERRVPFTMFGRTNSPLDDKVAWVDVDGCAGLWLATTHLLEQGHQRIGFIGWPPNSVAGDARYSGYTQALYEHDMTLDPTLIVRCENLVPEGYQAAKQLMSLAEPPTGVVALSDILAIGALRYFNEHHLAIALTGFDDIPTAEYISPPLTTLRQPIAEVAERLVSMLLAQLQGDALEESHYLLQPELIVRSSSLRGNL